jgi:hypothetical protein
MNEFAVNLTSERVDYGYLEVLIIGKAIAIKVLCEDPAMRNRFGIGVELQPNAIPHGDAVFHVKEEFLSALVCVVGQPILVPERLVSEPAIPNGLQTSQFCGRAAKVQRRDHRPFSGRVFLHCCRHRKIRSTAFMK